VQRVLTSDRKESHVVVIVAVVVVIVVVVVAVVVAVVGTLIWVAMIRSCHMTRM
jgi:hypothetical protein